MAEKKNSFPKLERLASGLLGEGGEWSSYIEDDIVFLKCGFEKYI